LPQDGGQTARKTVPLDSVPTLVGTPENIAARLKPATKTAFSFSLDAGQGQGTVELAPLYRTFLKRYTVYFPTLTAHDFAAQKEAREELAARTLDSVQPGNAASEAAHSLKSDKSATDNAQWRDAGSGGFFSYELQSDPAAPLELVLTFWGDDNGRRFDILINGQVVGTETLHAEAPGQQFTRTYPIPVELSRGQSNLSLRLQPRGDSTAGGLFGAKLLKRG